MTDEAYVFRQTELERKRIGRGDFNKKRQGGRHVRLPSDNLTNKEWKKMNGEIKTYNMNAPVSWKEFRAWPTDIQREYLMTQMKRYNVGTPEFAYMFGVSETHLQRVRKELGIPAPRGGRRGRVDEAGWVRFRRGIDESSADLLPPEETAPAEKCEDQTEAPSEKVDETPDELDEGVLRLAALLTALKGTGAKLTIEVTL